MIDRVTLRDYAIHSYRWVNFAGYGLMEFRFFVRSVKKLRAFVKETTTRLQWFRAFAKLGSATYAAICYLSVVAVIMREDLKTFFAHTVRHLLDEDLRHF
jgi:hypothetical protein